MSCSYARILSNYQYNLYNNDDKPWVADSSMSQKATRISQRPAPRALSLVTFRGWASSVSPCRVQKTPRLLRVEREDVENLASRIRSLRLAYCWVSSKLTWGSANQPRRCAVFPFRQTQAPESNPPTEPCFCYLKHMVEPESKTPGRNHLGPAPSSVQRKKKKKKKGTPLREGIKRWYRQLKQIVVI